MSTLASRDENVCGVLKAPDHGLQPVGTGILSVISSVSAEWRTTAVQYPALCTSFSCDIYRSNGEVNLVETYLQRSKTAPLSVVLDTGSESIAHLILASMLAFVAANPGWTHGPSLSVTQMVRRIQDLELGLPQPNYWFPWPSPTPGICTTRFSRVLPIHLTLQCNLLAFLRRSKCAFKKIVLDKCSFRPAETLQLLSYTLDLQSFTIRNGTLSTAVTERLLEALMGRREQPALLQELNHICIDGTYAFSDSLLAEIIQSQNPSSNSLTVEFFVQNRVVKEADLQRFRALGGVNFALYHMPAERWST
ncbi:hypothetical protein C8R43DRAFT_1137729 [Mycena crocata]|nr:hypothetical protein C8R43DRAFT_1137729 [Mycena crocata]